MCGETDCRPVRKRTTPVLILVLLLEMGDHDDTLSEAVETFDTRRKSEERASERKWRSRDPAKSEWQLFQYPPVADN